jgi:putative serine protease PepD
MADEPGGGRHRTWRDLPASPPLGPTAWAPLEPAFEAPAPPPPWRPSRRTRRLAGVGLLALVAVIGIGGLTAVAGETIGEVIQTAGKALGSPGSSPGQAAAPPTGSPSIDPGATPTPTPAPLDPADEQIASTVAKLLPSVVEIESASGTGAGFVAADGGWVLTASHVVGRETSVTLRLQDGSTTTATVVAVDSSIDTAVLRAERQDLPAAELGSSAGVRVGQATIAVGSPFGFSQTVTTGIVSGVGRTLPTQLGELTDLIQTDAPINPGNSGGPLADREGRIIGINTAIASQSGGSDGVGFAIPIDAAKEMLRKVQDGEWTAADDKPADLPSLTIPGLDDLFGPNGPLGGQGLGDLFGPNGPLGGQGLDDLGQLFGPDGTIDPDALDQLFGDLFGPDGAQPAPSTPDASPGPGATPSPAPDPAPVDPFGLGGLDDMLRMLDQLFGGGVTAPDGTSGSADGTGGVG